MFSVCPPRGLLISLLCLCITDNTYPVNKGLFTTWCRYLPAKMLPEGKTTSLFPKTTLHQSQLLIEIHLLVFCLNCHNVFVIGPQF